jgi:hypothetical protein
MIARRGGTPEGRRWSDRPRFPRRAPGPNRVACAALLILAVLPVASGARAEDSYASPVAGLTLATGPRWGWGSPSASTLGGVGLFAGWRAETVRVGALGRVDWWEGSRGPVVDPGVFLSWDYASLWIDPQLSLATLLRLEIAGRWESSASDWALAPSIVFGARAAGLEVDFAATYERWLSDLPDNSSKNGVDAEFRIAFDLFDVVHFAHALGASSTPLPP